MATHSGNAIGRKPRQKHRSNNENVNEPADLIENESAEIEREVPADENEPVEIIDDDKNVESPAFQE